MNIIGKFLIPFKEEFTLELPKGAKIIRIDVDNGNPYIWAVIDTNAPKEVRHFEAYKTGGEMLTHGKREYIGCAAIHIQMELMLYFFEVRAEI